MPANWLYPDRGLKPDGKARRVGVEIELSDVDVEKLTELIVATLGGQAERVSSAEFKVNVPSQGEYRVEVDFALLKDLARSSEEKDKSDEGGLVSSAIELLSSASTVIVPCEIVAPPIPMQELAEPMDALVERLRAAGAKGTRGSLLYAFGVHFNVEPPDLEVDTVTAYLRAFVCLYDWIVEKGRIDLSRQVTPFIRPYPRDYDLLVSNPDYRPSWPELIDDYLQHNPTRDRALDMLPMFAHIDEPRVTAVTDDPLTKPRPAFHYRLANSCVDEPGWSVAEPWNRWIQIERLAADTDALTACARAFMGDRERMLRSVDRQWAKTVTQWLTD